MKKPPSDEDEGQAEEQPRTNAGPDSTSRKIPIKPQIMEQLTLPLLFINKEAL